MDVFTCSLIKQPGAVQALEFRVLFVEYFRDLQKDSNMAKIDMSAQALCDQKLRQTLQLI